LRSPSTTSSGTLPSRLLPPEDARPCPDDVRRPGIRVLAHINLARPIKPFSASSSAFGKPWPMSKCQMSRRWFSRQGTQHQWFFTLHPLLLSLNRHHFATRSSLLCHQRSTRLALSLGPRSSLLTPFTCRGASPAFLSFQTTCDRHHPRYLLQEELAHWLCSLAKTCAGVYGRYSSSPNGTLSLWKPQAGAADEEDEMSAALVEPTMHSGIPA
jgi:hypothetical protein